MPSMPSKDGFGLHDEECFFPAQPGSRQEQREEPIRPPEFRPAVLLVQNRELLAKGQIFKSKVRT